MPAQRASVPDYPAIPTHNERDIHQDTARSGLRLALILVASFMVVLDFTIVNIALPSMERDFGVATDNRTDSRRWAQGVGPAAGAGPGEGAGQA
jgi:hypothetical protein